MSPGASLPSCSDFPLLPVTHLPPQPNSPPPPSLNLAVISLPRNISCPTLSIFSLWANVHPQSTKAWAWHCALGYKGPWIWLQLLRRSSQRYRDVPHSMECAVTELSTRTMLACQGYWIRLPGQELFKLKHFFNYILLMGAVTDPKPCPISPTSHFHGINI